jgi:drug/metabolite transporter (DMT)-like permease
MANLTLVSFSSAAILAPVALAEGSSFAIFDIQTLLSLIAYGIFSQALGWILISTGLPATRASRAGLLLLLQPALAFVWDVLFFKRETSIIGYTGVALTIFAIYLGSSLREKKLVKKTD